MKKLASILVLATVLSQLPVLAQGPYFNSGFNLPTGNGPAFDLAVDINGDGHPGLVSANFGFRYGNAFGYGGGDGSTLTVFTNDGSGNLYSNATLNVGLEPVGIAAADVNGDGKVDLICANVGDNTLTVLTNTGKGGFKLKGTYSVGLAPTYVAAADVNGDGKVDLISANFGDGTLTVLLNDGHGNFKQSAVIPVGSGSNSQPNCIAAVDINGDGKVDLVSANSGDGTLTTLTNNGKGVFTTTGVLGVEGGLGWVIGADVDGNGSIDLVTAGPTFVVLTNDGSGNFNLKSTAYSSGAEMVVAADMNGDGHVDLICQNNGNDTQGGASILLNDGTGNFTNGPSVSVGYQDSVNYPNCVTVADFDGDGNMDIAVACYGTALLTQLTQTDVESRPTVAITSPANDSVFAPYKNFTVNSTGVPTNTIYVALLYLDTNVVGAAELPPYNFTVPAYFVTPGTHALRVGVVSSGGVAWSPEQQIIITPGSLGAAPVVTITSPTNGTAFFTTQDLTIKATTSTPVYSSQLLVDGEVYDQTNQLPDTFQIPAGYFSPGGHTLQVTAMASGRTNASSAIVYITENAPGTALINFDALNTSAGAVGGTALAGYLSYYGVKVANATIGTALEAVNTNGLAGTIQVDVPSSPNFFTQAGLNQPVSFTLAFATPLQSFGFTRVGLSSSSGSVSHPKWTATIFDTNGTQLGSVSEPLFVSPRPLFAKSFVLTGANIGSVRFDSDSQGIAAFSAVLLDDLVLDSNPTVPNLSVAVNEVRPPPNGYVGPATITLHAGVTDNITSTYYVSFFSGPTYLGSVSNSPYDITLTNVLPGNYSFQAQATDVTGQAAVSPVFPVAVQLGPNSTLVNFDANSLRTSSGPVTGAALTSYLGSFGVTAAGVSTGTQLAVENQGLIAGGGLVSASSPPNLLTQTGSSGPVQFTLHFASLLSQFGFTRPELLAAPFVSHPAWQVTAFDGAGNVVGRTNEAEIDSAVNVGASEFSLGAPGGPGIATVLFASQGSGLTTFNGMLVDDLILTTNTGFFPPAVAITSPVSGLVLSAPPVVTITAAASDAKGLASVSFYTNGALLGTDTSSPYSVQWTNITIGNYSLTAVASNVVGLVQTSAVVNVVIRQSAVRFGIASEPSSQTVAAGGSATFTVVTTGTHPVTYQWAHNNLAVTGATSSTLVVGPPIVDGDAGTYTVAARSVEQTVFSTPAVLTVVDPPVISPQPLGETLSPGSTIAMNVGASGVGPFSFQWLLNGTPIPGATNTTFAVPSAQPLNSGSYQAAVANLAASVLSTVAPVVVQTAVIIPPTNNTFATRAAINPLAGPVAGNNIDAGVQTPLPDNLPGGNSIWFTWTPDFSGTVSLTTEGSDFDTVMAVYTGTAANKLTAVAADDDSGGFLTSLVTFNVVQGTTYQIAVDGFQGVSGRVVLGLPTGTSARTLSAASGAGVPVIIKGPASQSVAPGTKVTLSVQAKSTTKLTYQWRFQGVPIGHASASTFVIPHLQPSLVGLYDVLVANAAGSVQSEPADLQIAVNTSGKIGSAENKFINVPGTNLPTSIAVRLTPEALGGDTRGFSVSQVFSTVGATAEPGEPEPCGQAGAASQWFVYTAPAAGLLQVTTEGSTFNTIIGVYTGPGTSFASLVEVGCGYSTNYLVQGQPSVTLPAVTKGTTYYILVAGYQGASGVAQLQIGLGQPITFTSLPTSQLVTAGSNVTFSVATGGGIPSSFQWQLNGANVVGASKATLIVTDAQLTVAGNYTVIVSNVVGAVTSSPPAALTIQFAPDILSNPTNETVTLGQPAKFSVPVIGVNVKTNPFHYQWYFEGAPLPKATNAVLSFPHTVWTNNGYYSVVISNSYGVADSGAATLTVLDKTIPTVVILSPPINFTTNGSNVVVSGTATDNVGVAQVQVQVNTNGYKTAAGSNQWSIAVTLTPGSNLISARSMDLSGNLSLVAVRKVIYQPAGPTIAKAMSSSADNAISFAAGTYSGLFYPDTGATLASSGYFTATLPQGTDGAFSADILIDGGRYPFAGQFDSAGNASSVVPRDGKSSLSAILHLASPPADSQITGVISNADWSSLLTAGLDAYNAVTNPAPDVDTQFRLVAQSADTSPVGRLTISNTPGGIAFVNGVLVDGTSFFQTAPIDAHAAVPLYVPLYSGRGLYVGWINLTNSASQTNFGNAAWIRPDDANATGIAIGK